MTVSQTLTKDSRAQAVSVLHLAVLTRSAAMAESMRAAAGPHRLTVLPRDAAEDAVRRAAPDVLVADMDPADADDLALLERLAAWGLPVAAACRQQDVAVLRQLMRLGVVDVLPLPISPEDVAALSLTLARRGGAKARPPGGRVVSVLKAGGGVGATTLATQLACVAAAASGSARVCLLDLDIQFGSAALHLDLEPKGSILDVMEAVDRLDGALLRAAALHHGSGVDVLPAPPVLTPLDGVSAPVVARLVEAARQEYSLVVVELPQAWTLWTRSVLADSDGVMLVLDLTVASVRHARRQIDTLAEEGLGHIPLTLVANKVPEGLFAQDPAVSVAEAEQAVGLPVSVKVPATDLLFRAAMAGRPVGEMSGGKAVTRRLSALLRSVAGEGWDQTRGGNP